MRPQRLARLGGALYLVIIALGLFGEAVVLCLFVAAAVVAAIPVGRPRAAAEPTVPPTGMRT